MTDTTVLEASTRAKAGKGAARATRRAGLVPAVIYGAKKAPALVALDPRLVVRELGRSGWRARIYEIRSGELRERALMREVQLHPVSDKPIHVDFHRVEAGGTVRVEIAVVFEGEGASPGLKAGGVLNVDHHRIEVNVDPDRIPAHLVADVSALGVGGQVHWSDLRGTEGLEPTGHEADMVVATIAAPTVDAAPDEGDAGAPTAGGAAA